jgi:hypothetical protein
MKHHKLSLSLAGVLLAVGSSSSSAQSYSINWFKVAGGGGTAGNGVYAVAGTIGQHDASGLMAGGNYTLTGGFWSFLSIVPVPGAPLLSIRLTPTNSAQIYWPSPSTGFELQATTNPASASWTAPAESVTDDGAIKYIIVAPPTGNRFYRLKNP